MSGYPRVVGLFFGIMMIILMLKFVQREAICINFNETGIPSDSNRTMTTGPSAVVKSGRICNISSSNGRMNGKRAGLKAKYDLNSI